MTDPKHTIKICHGGACQRNFCRDTVKAAEQTLDMEIDTEKGGISLEKCLCLGNCSQGPSVMINDILYGGMFPKVVKKVLGELE